MQKNIISVIIISFILVFTSCTKETKPKIEDEVSKNTSIPTKISNENTTTNTGSNNKDNNEVKKDTNNDAPIKNEEESFNPTESTETSKLSNKEIHWGYRPNKEHKTPEIVGSVSSLMKQYSGYYTGDISSKELYLTFDEGYENGYTSKILDILKANNVPAAFFVTKPYITGNQELINRMVNEGHIVGNHTSTHPAMPSISDNKEKFSKEFKDTEDAFKKVTGKDMPKFFRPPMGVYSEKSLALTEDLGYKSVFWSFAHKDWEVNNQPSVEATKSKVIGGMHNGCILLLHAVSESNTNALDSILKELKADGYTFKSLESLK